MILNNSVTAAPWDIHQINNKEYNVKLSDRDNNIQQKNLAEKIQLIFQVQSHTVFSF